MTKRTKPKGSAATTHTIAPQASVETIESVEAKTNTTVAKLPKKANSTTTGASKRTRSKKAGEKVEINLPAPVSKVVDVDSRTITYVGENRTILVADKPPSLYDRFVGWLFRITLPFRGY